MAGQLSFFMRREQSIFLSTVLIIALISFSGGWFFAKNINAVINKGEKPQWNKRSQKQVADFWKQRWAIPRAEKDKRYQEFSKEKFIEQTFLELKEYKKIYKKLKSL